MTTPSFPHTYSHMPGEAGGGGKLSFAMLSGSSSDLGYFQLKEGASSKPLLISAVNWDYAHRQLHSLPRHEPTEPREDVQACPPSGNKNRMGGNPQIYWGGLCTGTQTDRRQWQPDPSELQRFPSRGRRCLVRAKAKERRCAERR